MVFNSVVFLFCFLPLSLLLYYLVPGRAKNAVLLAESLIFYCWTGVSSILDGAAGAAIRNDTDAGSPCCPHAFTARTVSL